MCGVVDVGGGCVASGGVDSTLRVWDVLSGQQLQQILTGDPFISAACLPDGQMATGHFNGEVRLWQLGEGGGALGVVVGHTSTVGDLALVGGGAGARQLLASGSQDFSIRLWDVGARTCAAVLQGHAGEVLCLADLGGGRLLSGARDRALRVWDVAAAACLTTVVDALGGRSFASSLCALPGGRAAVGGSNGSLRLWAWHEADKALAAEEGEPLARHEGFIIGIATVPDGSQLLTGAADSTLRRWARGSGGAWLEAAVLRGHTDMVRMLAVVRPSFCARQARFRSRHRSANVLIGSNRQRGRL